MSDGITDAWRGTYFGGKKPSPDRSNIINPTTTISSEAFDKMKSKADKWDKLSEDIAKCYVNEDGSKAECPDGLLTIGEIAASAFGWL